MEYGDQVAILRKDEDGWWLVKIGGHVGFVPGSYLVEQQLPIEPPVAPEPEPEVERPTAIPGLCSECSTQNPDVARFCRRCGNQLIE